MRILLEEICRETRNWFCDYTKGDIYAGRFQIEDGTITGLDGTRTPPITEGMHYRISGSYKNDGICLAGTDTPEDETFTGEIWLLHFPKAFLELCDEIKAWQDENGGATSTNMSPFTSESFGGYSYSKGGSGASGGTAVTWKAQYASRLNAWRKI
jgi:hypothetical protein